MKTYVDTDVAAREPDSDALDIDVVPPDIDAVQRLRAAAIAYAAYQRKWRGPDFDATWAANGNALPPIDTDAVFAWQAALAALTPDTLASLCDVWLLVEAEYQESEA